MTRGIPLFAGRRTRPEITPLSETELILSSFGGEEVLLHAMTPYPLDFMDSLMREIGEDEDPAGPTQANSKPAGSSNSALGQAPPGYPWGDGLHYRQTLLEVADELDNIGMGSEGSICLSCIPKVAALVRELRISAGEDGPEPRNQFEQ